MEAKKYAGIPRVLTIIWGDDDLKKQWYCPNQDYIYRSKLVTLYHNGKYYCNKIIGVRHFDEFLDWAEENGYTEGFDRETVNEAAEAYHYVMANAIEELNR